MYIYMLIMRDPTNEQPVYTLSPCRQLSKDDESSKPKAPGGNNSSRKGKNKGGKAKTAAKNRPTNKSRVPRKGKKTLSGKPPVEGTGAPDASSSGKRRRKAA